MKNSKLNEILLYQPNTLLSSLALLFLIFNTMQTIFTLNAVDVLSAGIRVMEIILTNIILSFLVFIAASQMKRYSLRWSNAALVIGIFQCLRFFLIPSGLRIEDILLTIVFPLEIAGILLMLAAIISIVKCKRYLSAKKEPECHT